MTSSIFVIVAEDAIVIHKKLTDILAKQGLETDAIHTYDLLEHTLDEVMEDIDTYSFLTPKKGIVVHHALFLSGEGLKEQESAVLHFERYVKAPNPDVTVVLITGKLDERKKIVKAIKKSAILVDGTLSIEKLVQESLDGYQVESGVGQLLVERCNQNVSKCYQECEKLKLYKYEEKTITKEDVLSLVTKSFDESDTYFFAFIQSIMRRDKKKALAVYQELLEQEKEPLMILVTLANQFRLLYQVKVLDQRGYRKDDMAKMLDCHPYRVEKTRELASDYVEEEIFSSLKKLADLDYQIKTGTMEDKLALELFLLGL